MSLFKDKAKRVIAVILGTRPTFYSHSKHKPSLSLRNRRWAPDCFAAAQGASNISRWVPLFVIVVVCVSTCTHTPLCWRRINKVRVGRRVSTVEGCREFFNPTTGKGGCPPECMYIILARRRGDASATPDLVGGRNCISVSLSFAL